MIFLILPFFILVLVITVYFILIKKETNHHTYSSDFLRGEIDFFEKTQNSFDFLWSKGLSKKNIYSLEHTETKRKDIDISEDIIWIRLSSNGNSNDLKYFTDSLLPKIKTPKIIVSSDGDNSVPSDLNSKIVNKILDSKYIKRWYTQNYDGTIVNPKLKHYPIGLDLHTNNLYPVEKVNRIIKIRNSEKKRVNRIFCDVHLSQNKKFNNERKRVYDILKDFKKIDFLDKRIAQEKIWENYSSYDLTVSTHGNGLDCHRTWEIILLGGTVVTKTSSLDYLFKDLPVVIVSDWDECLNLDLDEINDRFKHMKSNDYIYKFFTYKYWLN